MNTRGFCLNMGTPTKRVASNILSVLKQPTTRALNQIIQVFAKIAALQAKTSLSSFSGGRKRTRRGSPSIRNQQQPNGKVSKNLQRLNAAVSSACASLTSLIVHVLSQLALLALNCFCALCLSLSLSLAVVSSWLPVCAQLCQVR